MKNKVLTTLLITTSLALTIGVVFTKENLNKATASTDINDYSACETAHNNHNASGLLTALRNITAPGSAGSYSALWTTYNQCYVRSDGKIFDYYSSITNYVPGGSAQGANYDSEGDSYNREHSIPKSWWGGSESNQGADPYIVVPTDGYVNNGRGNLPFGMVKTATNTYSNSKKGSADTSFGYSGTVFEPDDSVKGDFARITFYAIAKYSASYGWTSGEGESCFSGSASTNFGLTNYAVKLFSYWSNLDPVSEWETSVNNKVANIQGNRNPFIDHPEYADTLWGNVSGYTPYSGGSVTPTISLSLNKTSASIAVDDTVSLTATLNNASGTINWTTSNSSIASLSASSGSSITVTGKAAGTATITAKATISGTTYSKTCTVTVTESGGSGGEQTEGSYTIVPTSFNGSGYSGGLIDDFSAVFSSSDCGNQNSTIQFKKSSGTIYNISPLTNITSIVITKSNSQTNALVVYGGTSSAPTTQSISASTSGNVYTYDFSSYSYPYFKIINGSSTSNVDSIVINYGGSTTTKTLSSISLNTTNVTKTFYVNDTFTYSGLVVTANYSDGSSKTVTPTSVSSPNMTTTGNKTVTVTYTEGGVSKTATYTITVSAKVITSITASVNKTYYVGETISTSDITVIDNNSDPVTNFTFANNNYQFTYNDASSGGSLTNKTFSNSITYNSLTCSLTVQVQRKAYETIVASVSDEITANDLAASDTTYKNFSGVSDLSGAVYAGNSAKDSSGNIQMRSNNSNSGIVSTTSGGTVSSVTIIVGSGTKTINVYGSNTAYSSASDLYNTSSQGTLVGSLTSTGTITFNSNYAYVGIRSNSGAIYISKITITYGGGASETPENVANYIMYEDTNNQCVNKFSIAEGYFNNLSKADKATFMTSDNYVLNAAKNRLVAWAAYHGKTISLVSGEYQIQGSNRLLTVNGQTSSNTAIIIAVAAMMSITGVCVYFYLRKKKEQ